MDNYIVINGKKAELTKEQLEKLGIKVEKENSFTRRPYGEKYYYITNSGKINFYCEDNSNYDTQMFDNVNYFNDKNFAQQVALHQLLYRKLLKYAYENDATDCDWTDSNSKKYFLSKDTVTNEMYIDFNYTLKHSGVVYFNSVKVAKQAIEDVVKTFIEENPDFVW